LKIKDLIINYWWAMLIILVVVIIIAFIIGNIQMNRKIVNELELLMKSTNESNNRNKIVEEELESLPLPVKKWLENVGVVGKEKIAKVTFSQRGKMKLNPDQKDWFEPEAKQYIRVDEPGYLWKVNLPMLPIINTKGRDLFYKGEGSMEIRIGSLIPVVNVSNNKKINESALHRFLLELPWYPTAALEEYITWEAINENSAKASLTYEGMAVDATFYFTEDDNLKRIESLRYKDSDEDAERIPCIGEIQGHKNIEGLKIPHLIDVTWIMDGKRFTWYKIENYDIKFENY